MLQSPAQTTKTLKARILSGSVVLLSGSGLATFINLAYNVAVARFLGPIGFGHATAVYTLLTLMSAVTLSFQIISAKLVAQSDSPETKGAIYRGFHRSAWACGIFIALLLFLFQRAIADYLNLPSPVLVALLAVGVAFYVPLGSRRGFAQGAYGFRSLATNLVLEGVVRLGGSLLLVLLGLGVEGVIAANSAAIAVAYLALRPKPSALVPSPLVFRRGLREIVQAMVFFSGQVLINNCDIVLVMHFFAPQPAGLYAAVAMVGRVMFALSSAVVNSMFPLVAGTSQEERKNLEVIGMSLMMVLGMGSVLALGLRLAPVSLWKLFFGPGFGMAGPHSLSYLMSLYAITTVLYSLSVVIITYEMSYKIANTSWVQLAFSGVLILGIWRYHASLQQVILVQLVLMVVLLLLVAIPFLLTSLTDTARSPSIAGSRPLRLLRRVSEDEVIAEFLKSDFSNPAFRDYQTSMRGLVFAADLDDAGENAKRRALFFIRHLALWAELPAETEWYEVEVGEAELAQIRVFPRAQWRNLARGDFNINAVAESLHKQQHGLEGAFVAKIAAIRERLQGDVDNLHSVILIGRDPTEPLTILDGNHRLVGAILASPRKLHRLRFLCGLSPKMKECCWYDTNLVTLFRYGKNVVTHVTRNPRAELARLLQGAG